MDSLFGLLEQFSRRLRLVDSCLMAQRTFWFALLISISFQIAGRFWPIKWLWLWALIPILIWAFIVIMYGYLKPIPLINIAHRIDGELNLRERLSTAIFLSAQYQDQGIGSTSLKFPQSMILAQQGDALFFAQSIQPKKSFPLKWVRRPIYFSGILALLLILLFAIPNSMNEVLDQREAIKSAAREQASKIEELQQEVAANGDLSESEKQELIRKLAELSVALQDNPGDIEQALADLSKVERDLRARLNPESAARQANLQTLAEQLKALSGEERDPNQEMIEAASEALNKLTEEMQNLTEEQRQELAKKLDQMAAQAFQSNNEGIAQALSEMSNALQNGNLEYAEQASQDLGEALQQANTQLADRNAINQALAQLQSSQRAMSQASSSQSSQADGNNQSLGETTGVGLAPVPGEGQPGGGGTKADTLPPDTGQGGLNPPQGNSPSTTEGELNDQVYAPWQQNTGSGDELFIPGQDSSQGENQSKEGEGNLPATSNSSLVPYSQVYRNYLNTAYQAIQQNYIPPNLLDYIRLYFTQLEPQE